MPQTDPPAALILEHKEEITMRIAVAGGTGVVGQHVVRAANRTGHEVVVIGRRAGVDVRTGEGLSDALKDVEVIIDVTDAGTTSKSKATAFFSEATGHLQSFGSAQGVSRLITLSIVGLERVPGFGYYEAKLAQEEAALAEPLPVRIVRSTQFHEFPAQILTRLRFGPISVMPTARIRPVAARSVGEFLVGVATEPGQPATVEIAGPDEKDLISLARAIVQRRKMRTSVLPLRLPGRAGKAMRSGAQLPLAGAHIVGPSFEEWLDGEDMPSVFA
jgi:uncharacterized protein YbjT (DUF2867 family)